MMKLSFPYFFFNAFSLSSRRILHLVILLFLTSCYQTRELVLPLQAPEEALEKGLLNSGAYSTCENEKPLFVHGEIPEEWWNLFHDGQLACLIEMAIENNPSLQAAYEKILFAQFTADKARSTLFPMINFNGDVQRDTLSKTAQFPKVPPILPFTYTLYEGQFNFAYDLDLWGKNRNMFRAALGEVQSAIADELYIRLALSISVADLYYQIQVGYRRRELSQALVKNLTRYLAVIEQRQKNHLVSQIDVLNAQDQLAAAQRGLSLIEQEIETNQHQLWAFVAGNFDERVINLQITSEPLPFIPIPCDLPLNLIAHRPDIISQLWLIESAGYQIEVAKAGFYPDFNLTGFAGYQTIHLKKLFEGQSGYSTLELATSLPIFTAGLLQANLSGTEVQYDLAVLKYNELVLNAAKEVLDGLTLVKKTHERLEISRKQMKDEEQINHLTSLRVNKNLNSELDLLLQQQSLIGAQDNEAIAMGETLHAMLFLIKSLGGGF